MMLALATPIAVHVSTTVALPSPLPTILVTIAHLPSVRTDDSVWTIAGAVASILVAVGTLALAAATFASVTQTRAVLLGEERRHQQGFAPVVVAEFTPVFQKQVLELLLKNDGHGLAFDVIVSIIADCWKIHPTGPYETREVTGATSVVPMYTRNGEYTAIRVEVGSDYVRAECHRIRIDYSDMFGNPYSSTYADFTASRQFHWDRPRNLASSVP